MQRARAGCELAFSVAAQPRRVYSSEPASGRGPGVLVVHEAGGLGEFPRDVCDRLAREGFVALAPEWLEGSSAAPVERAGPRAEALDPAPCADTLDAAVSFLLGRDACDGPRVGALGFGQGGVLALDLAARNRRIGAVVSFWGAHPRLVPDVAKLEAACLAVFAERDDLAPPAAARSLEASLRAAGRRAAVKIVPAVAAGFLDSGRPTAFDATAAAAAWDGLLTFLRAELA